MYKAGEITMEPSGWFIEILDPDGDCICSLHVEAYVKAAVAIESLKTKAEGLLSHLNR